MSLGNLSTGPLVLMNGNIQESMNGNIQESINGKYININKEVKCLKNYPKEQKLSMD